MNNNDFILPIVNTQLYFEYLENAEMKGVRYFETKVGKIELEFFSKLSNKLYLLVEENINRTIK